ncbi:MULTISPECIES: hypothetical protein [Alteromonas]|jgi:hypothetical protein|uniref:Uncharacterized protein n=2 Tax=cellular organisms TaxID=131567 RepID=A0AAC8XPG8_9ALTE|nr:MULTISPECIES: hypothetical protein [Alteromonas]AFV87846.1 hypothetical protein amad1_22063 [Alteromonas mediterranea DE1]AGP87889.1 hypothetical protein I607_20792 [Alteromonas mediterranea U4]AGP99870.1 hypothetical protein I635_22079 [Alteromonas mediterranea UM7]AMJ80937.1 hypothetical protein AV942_21400 [Alteromonas mediterranea]AMJ85098.1 hypothetical protein AV941_21510 [Alteromonas mediterranea]|tara:strand:- start:309 stop:1184 length:876 start_codon:yes stop_codon:yes gene_type:complete|mmetsp:Transcript_41587/g.107632  ORF Transcript_41587/g.107632 Transcript_41587/m.107632 type:complete len:292 (+) Transcript_41587:650-1525(+)
MHNKLLITLFTTTTLFGCQDSSFSSTGSLSKAKNIIFSSQQEGNSMSPYPALVNSLLPLFQACKIGRYSEIVGVNGPLNQFLSTQSIISTQDDLSEFLLQYDNDESIQLKTTKSLKACEVARIIQSAVTPRSVWDVYPFGADNLTVKDSAISYMNMLLSETLVTSLYFSYLAEALPSKALISESEVSELALNFYLDEEVINAFLQDFSETYSHKRVFAIDTLTGTGVNFTSSDGFYYSTHNNSVPYVNYLGYEWFSPSKLEGTKFNINTSFSALKDKQFPSLPALNNLINE